MSGFRFEEGVCKKKRKNLFQCKSRKIYIFISTLTGRKKRKPGFANTHRHTQKHTPSVELNFTNVCIFETFFLLFHPPPISSCSQPNRINNDDVDMKRSGMDSSSNGSTGRGPKAESGLESSSSGRSTPTADLPHNKLFVGGLSWQTSADKLREYFGQYGTIIDVQVLKDPLTQVRSTTTNTFEHETLLAGLHRTRRSACSYMLTTC